MSQRPAINAELTSADQNGSMGTSLAEAAFSKMVSKLRCAYLAAFLFLVPCALTSQQLTANGRERLTVATEHDVRMAAERFAQILTSSPRQSQLQVACSINCSAVADPRSGSTVSGELEHIQAIQWAELLRAGAEINASIDQFLGNTVLTNQPSLHPALVSSALNKILSRVSSRPPAVFILSSPRSRSLLVFYDVQYGPVGDRSSSVVLRAYNAGAAKLKVSDSTGSDMDGCARLNVKELHSPVENEIWLLMTGYMTGANGPNMRMRIVAYDGKRFRTVWMPANEWGDFTTAVTRGGFRVDGQYYRSAQHKHDQYQIAPDGLYSARHDK